MKKYLNALLRNECDTASPYGSSSTIARLVVQSPFPMDDIVPTSGHQWHLTLTQYDFRGNALRTTVGTASDPDSEIAVRHPDMYYVKRVFTHTGKLPFVSTTVRRAR